MLQNKPEKQNIDFNTYRKAFSVFETDKAEESFRGGIKVKTTKAAKPTIIERNDKPIIVEKTVFIENDPEVIERTIILSGEKKRLEKKVPEFKKQFQYNEYKVKGHDIPWLL